MRLARVIVDIPARTLDRPFDYSLPEGVDVLVGTPVLVPFGGRKAVGYVVGLPSSTEFEVKDVIRPLGKPVFRPEAFGLAEWIAAEYVCGIADALRLMLPPGGRPHAVRGVDGEWELERPAVGEVQDTLVSLVAEKTSAEIPARAVRQRAVLDAVSQGPVRLAELQADLGDVRSAVQALSAKGIVRLERIRRYRRADGVKARGSRPDRLTEAQEGALAAIGEARGKGRTVLLDGVTGSGKTEVYLRAIEEVITEGGTAIVLVPEISLTPQTVGRFRARFGGSVAVTHSRLSAGERFDQWSLAMEGSVSVMVGPRSALFAPMPDLGLIVIDEEHETSYKQGSTPRYHARDVARELAHRSGAALILGSATPSLETFAATKTGTALHVSLPERATGAAMPEVRIVDMTKEFAEGHRSMLSRPLLAELSSLEAASGKAIVLLNRRGFASFLLCRECGFVPRCAQCSVSLTHHEGGRLQCHHCGVTRPVPAACPECSSPYLRMFGAGTQRAEKELEAAVPDLPVVRMDADTTRKKGGHEKRLAEFEALDKGILLGTQMIAKGLDYPDVTLVGVLAADLTLNLPDFRAAERTFQLLEQVAGRAGRADEPGKVILQTYWPEHPAIRAVAECDRESFYASELRERAALGYPPATRLARVLVTGSDETAVAQAAEEVAGVLESVARKRESLPGGRTCTVLGPAPAAISRIRGMYRWHVLLKCPAKVQLAAIVGEAMEVTRHHRSVTVVPDIDPTDVM